MKNDPYKYCTEDLNVRISMLTLKFRSGLACLDHAHLDCADSGNVLGFIGGSNRRFNA